MPRFEYEIAFPTEEFAKQAENGVIREWRWYLITKVVGNKLLFGDSGFSEKGFATFAAENWWGGKAIKLQ